MRANVYLADGGAYVRSSVRSGIGQSTIDGELLGSLSPEEYGGQLVAIVKYEPALGDYDGDQGGPERRHVIECDSVRKPIFFWLGRLADDWAHMPLVERAIALDQSGGAWVEWLELKSLLHPVATGDAQDVVVCLGTSDVLDELESVVFFSDVLDALEDRVLEAVFRLGIAQTELARHAPSVAALITQVMGGNVSECERLDAEIKASVAAHEQAVRDFEATQALLMQRRMTLHGLAHMYETWREAQEMKGTGS